MLCRNSRCYRCPRLDQTSTVSKRLTTFRRVVHIYYSSARHPGRRVESWVLSVVSENALKTKASLRCRPTVEDLIEE